MSFDEMLDSYKNYEDLFVFAKAQNRTISDLTRQLSDSKDKVKHLESLLPNSSVTIEPSIIITGNSTDEEIICRAQLSKLKIISSERELTLEETKRTEIFSKILQNLNSKKKPEDKDNIKEVSNADLIKQLDELNVSS